MDKYEKMAKVLMDGMTGGLLDWGYPNGREVNERRIASYLRQIVQDQINIDAKIAEDNDDPVVGKHIAKIIRSQSREGIDDKERGCTRASNSRDSQEIWGGIYFLG